VSDRASLHVRGEILANKRVGAYRLLTVAAKGIPERTRPGTFVAVSVPQPALARRALWVYRVKPTGGYGPTLDLLVHPRGTGTRWLAQAPPGTPVEVTGPLGRAWALPKEPAPALLVGDGYAAASLFGLAERLRQRGCPVTMLLAGEDEAHLVSALEARRSARSVTVVTADGSVGRRGTVPDVVEETLRAAAPAIVYVAGPLRTLAAVAAVAEQAGVWSQVAVETSTPCATGLCHGCGVPVLGEDGIARVVRGCTEGPVFRGDRVRWAELEHE
jgi:dihydroorotate dehydrogenase electron transfer subunit